MRAEFADAVLAAAAAEPRLVFLTGDLGFMALEKVQAAMGARFINAGVAEQNMIGVAAGLAAQGLIPLVYSIAPFVTLRPYEHIRNDVCFHRLPVKIVGNGGGYGYGIMGGTHHVLQDIGAMRMLPDMRVYVPLFGTDVATATAAMIADPGPGYLRLNLGVKGLSALEPFAPWRRVVGGTAAVAVSTGPVAGGLVEAVAQRFPGLVAIWSVGTFPFGELPAALIEQVARTGRLLTIEEHCGPGGLGEAMAGALLGRLPGPVRFRALAAKGYPSGRYGSQQWHLQESGLAGKPLMKALEEWMDDGDRRTSERAG